MRKALVLFASASFAALLVSAGCSASGNGPGSSSNAVDAVTVDSGINPVPNFALCPPTGATDGGAPVLDDGQIVGLLMAANDAEIAQGQLAAQRALAADARDFGNRMVTEHTAANARLQSLAQSLGLTAQPSAMSEQLRNQALQTTSILQSLPTASFDLAYLDSQVAGHANVIFMADSMLLTQASNTQLKAEVANERAAAQTHLDTVTRLQSNGSGTHPNPIRP